VTAKQREEEPEPSKVRFDDEIPGVTTPKATSRVVITPSERMAPQASSASRFVATPKESRPAWLPMRPANTP
jgi:hypothetical protein